MTLVIAGALGVRFRYAELHATGELSKITPVMKDECAILLSNAYGAVVGSTTQDIPHATVDKVILYSQKDANSIGRLDRPAILVRYPEAKATILICHGFMCDKFDAGFLRRLCPRKGGGSPDSAYPPR